MKRAARLLIAVLGVTSAIAAAAWAASSPTVSTQSATNLTDTTARLRATVNPNGNDTSYAFQYGPTSAYGLTTSGHAIGHGIKPVAVTLTITGLTPGTIYHYHVVALNRSGSASGRDQAFTTTGHPPPAPVTGSAVNVGQTVATPTGSVNPQGDATTWLVQYGLTIGYGVQTFPQALPAVNTSLPVSVELQGLAPGKLFHYRIVAAHGAVISYGADATFFTLPSYRRTPRMITRSLPSRDRRPPYAFSTSGTLSGANFVPAALRCTGTVDIRYYDGKRQVQFAVASVQPNCRFSAPVTFKRLIGGHGSTPLTVAIHFRGNGYLKAVDRTDHVTLG